MTDGRWFEGFTISSSCEPNGSGELKSGNIIYPFKSQWSFFLKMLKICNR